MTIITRSSYNADVDIAEGDLVSVGWDETEDVGIILKVAIDVRNEDHLCPSEEILIAEVYICGNVLVFDEEDLIIVEKCK